MLLNLVLNALRETPTDGKVSLSGRVAGGDVIIEVGDTGTGIHEQKLARIFDPVFSTSRDGCGLGLPIVKRIVESHNGTIDVTSSKRGTTFVIRIPQTVGAVYDRPLCRA
jgi:signal transduction histidine kinase